MRRKISWFIAVSLVVSLALPAMAGSPLTEDEKSNRRREVAEAIAAFHEGQRGSGVSLLGDTSVVEFLEGIGMENVQVSSPSPSENIPEVGIASYNTDISVLEPVVFYDPFLMEYGVYAGWQWINRAYTSDYSCGPGQVIVDVGGNDAVGLWVNNRNYHLRNTSVDFVTYASNGVANWNWAPWERDSDFGVTYQGQDFALCTFPTTTYSWDSGYV